jgi:hypothetical protein
MALVSHQHGFIYLKTFKTGSTSVEMALQPLCTPPGTKVRQFGPAIVSDSGIVGARGKHVGADRTGWHNHMSAKRVAWKLGPRRWMRYLKVASLRNPFDKAVSWYWFWADKDGRAHDGSVEDFRAFIREREAAGHFRSRRDTDWHVTHILGRPVIDQYIRLEHLQTDLTLMYARLGITGASLDVPRVKTRTRKQDPRAVADYYDTPTADILRRNWDWIFEAGGYSLDPADAGRASSGCERQETGAAARGSTPEAEGGPTVKSELTRRAG